MLKQSIRIGLAGAALFATTLAFASYSLTWTASLPKPPAMVKGEWRGLQVASDGRSLVCGHWYISASTYWDAYAASLNSVGTTTTISALYDQPPGNTSGIAPHIGMDQPYVGIVEPNGDYVVAMASSPDTLIGFNGTMIMVRYSPTMAFSTPTICPLLSELDAPVSIARDGNGKLYVLLNDSYGNCFLRQFSSGLVLEHTVQIGSPGGDADQGKALAVRNGYIYVLADRGSDTSVTRLPLGNIASTSGKWELSAAFGVLGASTATGTAIVVTGLDTVFVSATVRTEDQLDQQKVWNNNVGVVRISSSGVRVTGWPKLFLIESLKDDNSIGMCFADSSNNLLVGSTSYVTTSLIPYPVVVPRICAFKVSASTGALIWSVVAPGLSGTTSDVARTWSSADYCLGIGGESTGSANHVATVVFDGNTASGSILLNARDTSTSSVNAVGLVARSISGKKPEISNLSYANAAHQIFRYSDN
jgi:hypothetical protein